MLSCFVECYCWQHRSFEIQDIIFINTVLFFWDFSCPTLNTVDISVQVTLWQRLPVKTRRLYIWYLVVVSQQNHAQKFSSRKNVIAGTQSDGEVRKSYYTPKFKSSLWVSYNLTGMCNSKKHKRQGKYQHPDGQKSIFRKVWCRIWLFVCPPLMPTSKPVMVTT
jgi:hypothetical protein